MIYMQILYREISEGLDLANGEQLLHGQILANIIN